MADLVWTLVDADTARTMTDEIRDLYAVVYAEPPYCEGPEHVRQFGRWWSDHLRQPGFTLATARDAGRLVGAVYGHTMPPGDWMEPDADEPPAGLRQATKLFVVEWMVLGGYRGQGVGRRLLGMLLDGRAEQWAVLAANPAAPARRLYERMGWQQHGQIRPRTIPDMDVMVLRLNGRD
ncbi:GNAT family N-acetyltransferase [Verrucosispora sp. WMMC514]|uniref:GNAT family N-acetyltransferase n=1 Tax=Verrucosispora sp. WMMC514 TaxID=3015156 RepID=UPI00248AC1BA|nr:GNAT family N-acetyltransferase [Verrucosispora sp. WMMC514]WBB94159.1 GNAT family N-acetyltransferase [Verrucosispora sp. WMMC514]